MRVKGLGAYSSGKTFNQVLSAALWQMSALDLGLL